MNETEISRHINKIYVVEALLHKTLSEADGNLYTSQMRLDKATIRRNDREKAESQRQIEAAAEALHTAKMLIDELSTNISFLEVSMTILKGLAKDQI